MDCSLPSGCLVKQADDSQPSFGDSFAQAGGGVWAVQYDIECVPIPRHAVLLIPRAVASCEWHLKAAFRH